MAIMGQVSGFPVLPALTLDDDYGLNELEEVKAMIMEQRRAILTALMIADRPR